MAADPNSPNTFQLAPVVVKDYAGNIVTGASVTSDNPGVASVVDWAGGSAIVGVAEGDATITARRNNSQGTVMVHVSAAPLSVSLGAPVAK